MTEIQEELAKLADDKYRVFQSKLVPGVEHILGVRIPMLWKLAKRLVRENGAGALQLLTDDTYEEVMLQGMAICLLKETPEQLFERLPGYMGKIDNWAECDIICSGLKKLKECPQETLLFLTPFLSSDKEFEVRFAVVLLLDYFVTDLHIDQTLSLLDSVKHPSYYAKVAVAWALSVCYIEYPEKTEAFLFGSNTLDDMTYNKTLQKIIESNRVDRETKAHLRGMKRKSQGGMKDE